MTARTRAGGGAGPGARGDERGLTMIELVVAVSVFAILAGGLALTIEGGPEPRPQQPQPQHRRQPGQPGDGQGPPDELHHPAARARRALRRRGRGPLHRAARVGVGRQRLDPGPVRLGQLGAPGPARDRERVLARHARRHAREVVDDPEPTGRLLRPGQRPHRGEGAGPDGRAPGRGPGLGHRDGLRPEPDHDDGRLCVLRVRTPGHLHGRARVRSATSTARGRPARPRSPGSRRARSARSRSTTTRLRR